MPVARHWVDRAAALYVTCILAIYAYLAAAPQIVQAATARFNSSTLSWAGEALSSNAFRTVLLLAAYGGLWTVYLWALKRAGQQELSAKRVWLWGALFVLLLLAMPPYFSNDIIGYAQQGRLMTHYGQNPYEHTLSEHGDAWVEARQHWSWQKSPYGPLLTVIHGSAAAIAGDKLWLAIALLKLVMAASFLLTALLVQKILQRVAPAAATAGVLFVLWNPLALLEFAGQGHNDAVMMALMMCGLWLIAGRRQAPGFVALFLSFLSKFATAILLPLHAALLLRRREWRAIAIAAVACVALLAGAYVAFFRDASAATISGLREVSSLAWLSPTWLGSELLRRNGWELEAARRVFQLPLTLAFLAFVLWRATRVTNERALLRESGIVLAVFLLAVNNQMNPWYLALLVPVAAVARHPVIRAVAVAISLWPAIMYFRPFLYNSPFWANVGRALLLYSGLCFAVVIGLRALRRERETVPAIAEPVVSEPIATTPTVPAPSFEAVPAQPTTIRQAAKAKAAGAK